MRLVAIHLLQSLTVRDIRSRFVGNTSGWIGLIFTPLLLLGVYAYVFGVIFQARVPDDLNVPFVAWLAVALWPWLAFSDGALKGSQAIHQNAALLSKIAIPRWILPVSANIASFLLQLFGYVVILIALLFLGLPLKLQSLPYLLLLLASLSLLSVGLSLWLAALVVFLRDIEQFLPTFFMFWFFLTPILYPMDMLPYDMQFWLWLNPMTWWVEEIRAAIFGGKWLPDHIFLLLISGAGCVVIGGQLVFARLSPSFEDFL